MHILIAEDDPTSRHLLKIMLEKEGHTVVPATNGAEALQLMSVPNAPRLAILDWIMPEMDGLAVTRAVRELNREPPPYLIILTSRGEKADIVTGLAAGADDYLVKPFDRGELLARTEVGQRLIKAQEELIASREALAYQATHDVLTGILNRRAILDRLHDELERLDRMGQSLAVGLCDLDHFKRINDHYGHATGDTVLRVVTQCLTQHLREYDVIGRLGGEEFLILAPIQEDHDSRTVFERLRRIVAEQVIDQIEPPIQLTLSIGVACTQGQKISLDRLLSLADEALYIAKNSGRNQIRLAAGC